MNDNDTILLFPFSRKQEDRETACNKDKKRFESHNDQKSLNFLFADDNIKELIENIKKSEVLYFRGGITQGHLDMTNQIPDLKKLLVGKTILGTSAGALMRGKYYYSQDFEEVRVGNGFLDTKIIAHIRSDYSDKKTDEERIVELDSFGEKIDIITVEEKRYVVYDL